MDDFTLATLQDSRNEWCMQLVNILTPLVIEGFNSIFQESWKLCESNDEEDKYLMTFQNFIARVPKWNSEVITKETQRILERSACNYMEDLLTCVHVIQLKVLTCIRVSKNQKKVDINIPKLDDYIHKLYIQVARKLYSNVYLYDKFVTPLQKQKHNREFEVIVQECILNTIRTSMPIEEILRSYLDETIEEDVEETIKEEEVPVEEEITEKQEVDDMDNGNTNATNTTNTKNTTSNSNEPLEPIENSIDNMVQQSESNEQKKEITFGDYGTMEQNHHIDTIEEISKLRGIRDTIDNQVHNEIYNDTSIESIGETDSSILQIKDDVDRHTLNVETIGGAKQVRDDPPILNDIQILV